MYYVAHSNYVTRPEAYLPHLPSTRLKFTQVKITTEIMHVDGYNHETYRAFRLNVAFNNLNVTSFRLFDSSKSMA